jgi:DNA polymerase sigma
MNTVDRLVLERFKRLLTQHVPLDQVIVFGSRARGDAESESDMDVIVVLTDSSDDADRDRVSDCAWEAGFTEGIVIVPVVFTRQQWQQGPEHHSLLAQAVRREGISV